eukprot:GDKI01016804.1.p1 GENE.GDKI01016804.1~~GDKI01016804.1.p1  ORF type:complete len:228 (+),score=61.15 GDKI01016804.1:2-685(+)
MRGENCGLQHNNNSFSASTPCCFSNHQTPMSDFDFMAASSEPMQEQVQQPPVVQWDAMQEPAQPVASNADPNDFFMSPPRNGGGMDIAVQETPTAEGEEGGVGVPTFCLSAKQQLQQSSNAMREWEQEHEKELLNKAKEEDELKKQQRENAKAELQKFYEEREKAIAKKKEMNRQQQTGGSGGDMGPDGSWAMVAGMIAAVGAVGGETTRMKQILGTLANAPPPEQQ